MRSNGEDQEEYSAFSIACHGCIICKSPSIVILVVTYVSKLTKSLLMFVILLDFVMQPIVLHYLPFSKNPKSICFVVISKELSMEWNNKQEKGTEMGQRESSI